MTTTWKSSNQATNNDTISGTTLSSWSRQQKLAMIAGFAILGLLLAVSACSKQSPKPALVGVSSPTSSSATPAAAATPATTPTAAVSPAPAKKTPKKRPANVTYSDANSGVSFLYPRKFALTSGDKAQPQLAGMSDVPMNFVQPGGVAVATVALPGGSYPGTDFASAFFNVNVNRSVSEQECEHFAFVDTRNADGEPVDAEKVKIGSTDMEMTSNFSASVIAQAETQYYHSYENGACYEYVLGLGTEGFATEGGIEHVNRDEVFAKLEKILATVKINPVEQEHVAETAATNITGGKE
ncbi:MAG TPA: hypothetical protein VKI40_01250 [Terriglobales bacterium]|nr:hypothetical protein [Terriglobales bacterium]